MRQDCFAVLACLMVCLGCGHGLSDAKLQQASRPGVYVETASELVEISSWGDYKLDRLSQEVAFKFEHSVPQVSGPMAFVTNVPGAAADDAKVFLLPRLDAGVWHEHFGGPADTQPVESSSHHVSGSVYTIVPELPKGATGFLCLRMKMPPGSDDRMYAVQIK